MGIAAIELGTAIAARVTKMASILSTRPKQRPDNFRRYVLGIIRTRRYFCSYEYTQFLNYSGLLLVAPAGISCHASAYALLKSLILLVMRPIRILEFLMHELNQKARSRDRTFQSLETGTTVKSTSDA